MTLFAELLVPFEYNYMVKAMVVAALVGATCAFLSAYLIMKGWSLMGDALAHSVVPGVALAYILKVPYALGAFFTGLLAAAGMAFVRQVTTIREDAIIGMVFTAFFAGGLYLASVNPISINIQAIVLGDILSISDADALQVALVAAVTLVVLGAKWRDLMLVFFDERQAKVVGIEPLRLKILFFTLLSAATVAALQTVGACLVIAMVVTPGATAYLLTDRFGRLIGLSVAIGATTSFVGAYLSFFLDGATGGVIVVLQTLVFLSAFVFAPKHGILAGRRQRMAKSAEQAPVTAGTPAAEAPR